MFLASLFTVILFSLGMWLRRRFAVFHWLYIPASVIGGLIGLLVIQAAPQSVVIDANDIASTLSSWPGWLIAFVFGGMLLEREPKPIQEKAAQVRQQVSMVWIIILGETTLGLIGTWLLIQPFYELPSAFGMLIETGFAGGHGTAAAMGEVFSHPVVDLPLGRDLGMLMATAGLIYGIVSGIFWINVAARLGWARPNKRSPESQDEKSGRKQFSNHLNPSTATRVLVQLVWLLAAVAIGYAMQQVVMSLAGVADQWRAGGEEVDAARKQLTNRLSIASICDFPLFIYTLFGGWILRRASQPLQFSDRIEPKLISAITGVAMDILVVAAIASLNLHAVVSMVVPWSILFVLAAIWTGVCLMVIAKRILPKDYWFELGLINYGMSTGTTATGFVLLRVVDPNLSTDAAEDYALAAPFSAPFIGGGILTVAIPLLILPQISLPVLVGVLLIVLAALFWLSQDLKRKL